MHIYNMDTGVLLFVHLLFLSSILSVTFTSLRLTFWKVCTYKKAEISQMNLMDFKLIYLLYNLYFARYILTDIQISFTREFWPRNQHTNFHLKVQAPNLKQTI